MFDCLSREHSQINVKKEIYTCEIIDRKCKPTVLNVRTSGSQLGVRKVN